MYASFDPDIGVQRTGELLVEYRIFDFAEQTSSGLFSIYNSVTSNFGTNLFVIWKAVNFPFFVKDGSLKTKARHCARFYVELI